jgi:exodeoxyribonuclease V alpha subunit
MEQQPTALERAFVAFIQRLAGAGACPALLNAVGRLSRARSEGHICVELATGGDGDELRDELLATPVVGGPGARRPLIVDGPYLYLQRYHQAETLVADFIMARRGTDLQGVSAAALASALACFFPGAGVSGPDWQQVAALAALSRRFTVISGGPGTGKTTTVAKILAIHQELHQGRNRIIRLAAPTGKAAARLQQSIQQAKAGLPGGAAQQEALPHDTVTLHRLLGLSRGRPRYDRHHPLAADLVVVDEASMVDLPLMAQLMDALPPQCGLLLVGDHYQLSSVQPGAVLGDICGQGQGFSAEFQDLARQMAVNLGTEVPVRATTLADGIITLQRSYRFQEDSGIRRLSAAVNRGDADEALAVLADQGYPDVTMVDPGSRGDELVPTVLAPAFAGLARARSKEEQLAALGGFGVLCALRRGPTGMERLNEMLVDLLAPSRSGPSLYHGLPIMIAVNNYELALYNGDTGVMNDDGGRLTACFPSHEGVRQVLARRLPPYDPAYAMTVHKSQGSEFERVVVVLPGQPSRVLGRELLYTALTRARQAVEVWGTEEVFRQAVSTPVLRVSGLGRRLWGSPAAGAV